MCQFHTLPHQRNCQINVQNHLRAATLEHLPSQQLLATVSSQQFSIEFGYPTRPNRGGSTNCMRYYYYYYYCYNVICVNVCLQYKYNIILYNLIIKKCREFVKHVDFYHDIINFCYKASDSRKKIVKLVIAQTLID